MNTFPENRPSVTIAANRVESVTTRGDTLTHWWRTLSAGQRATVVTVGALDASLRIAALVDLARRPAGQVRGPKWRWAVSLGVVNSLGVLPLAYLIRGRRPDRGLSRPGAAPSELGGWSPDGSGQ